MYEGRISLVFIITPTTWQSTTRNRVSLPFRMGVSQLSSDRAVSTWHFPLMPVLLMLVQHLQHDGNHQKTWSIISVQLSCMQLSQGFPTKKMHPQLYCYARYLFVHAIYNGHSKAEVLKQVKFYHQMPACGTLQTTNVIQISRLLYRLTMLLLPRLLRFSHIHAHANPCLFAHHSMVP